MNEARLAGHRLELYLERATQPCVVEAVLVPEAGMDVSWERDQTPGIHIEGDLERLAARIVRDEVLTHGAGRPDRRPARSTTADAAPGHVQPAGLTGRTEPTQPDPWRRAAV